MSKFKVCIIKFGALGDVVRTSYLINAIALEKNAEITWITKSSSLPLLKNNPNITKLVDSKLIYKDILMPEYDEVISLDDEYESAKIATRLKTKFFIGAFVEDDKVTYSDNSSVWFDMGLISKFGKNKADELKKNNKKSHTEIFKNILNVKHVTPIFYGDKKINAKWKIKKDKNFLYIGFNLFSGERWPSKEIYQNEQVKLINLVDKYLHFCNIPHKLIIYNDNSSTQKANFIQHHCPFVYLFNTTRSVLEFNAAILLSDYVISSDSLGLHLAIANSIPNLSFYGPTSSAEIDTFETGVKVISLSNDYCSYKKVTDNSSLSAERIFSNWQAHFDDALRKITYD